MGRQGQSFMSSLDHADSSPTFGQFTWPTYSFLMGALVPPASAVEVIESVGSMCMCVFSKRTGTRVCVTGITDQYNVRGGKVELNGSPVTRPCRALCYCMVSLPLHNAKSPFV